MAKKTLKNEILELEKELQLYIKHEQKTLKEFAAANSRAYAKIFSENVTVTDETDTDNMSVFSSNRVEMFKANLLNMKSQVFAASEAPNEKGSKGMYQTLRFVLDSYKDLEKSPEICAVEKYMMSYVKALAASEALSAISPNKSPEDTQTELKTISNDDAFQVIMKTNPDSNTLRALKILSLIAIIVGVGIITTAALAGKRLYDTNGRSANFFKPLSAVVLDSMKAVENVKETAPAA